MTALVIAVQLLLAGAAASPAGIAGDYVEVRSNHVYTCGCLFAGEQATGGREAILAWAFRQGEFQGAPLAGIRVVAVVNGPASLSIEQTPRRSVLFVDGLGSDGQEAALLALLRQEYAKPLGEIMAVRRAPILFQQNGEEVTVSVGEVSRIVTRPARLPEDAHRGSFLWYAPFVATSESTLGFTEYAGFSGEDFHNRWWTRDAGINGYIAKFSVAR